MQRTLQRFGLPAHGCRHFLAEIGFGLDQQIHTREFITGQILLRRGRCFGRWLLRGEGDGQIFDFLTERFGIEARFLRRFGFGLEFGAFGAGGLLRRSFLFGTFASRSFYFILILFFVLRFFFIFVFKFFFVFILCFDLVLVFPFFVFGQFLVFFNQTVGVIHLASREHAGHFAERPSGHICRGRPDLAQHVADGSHRRAYARTGGAQTAPSRETQIVGRKQQTDQKAQAENQRCPHHAELTRKLGGKINRHQAAGPFRQRTGERRHGEKTTERHSDQSSPDHTQADLIDAAPARHRQEQTGQPGVNHPRSETEHQVGPISNLGSHMSAPVGRHHIQWRRRMTRRVCRGKADQGSRNKKPSPHGQNP